MPIKLMLIICIIFALNEAAALDFHENISVNGGGQLACRTYTKLADDSVDAIGTQKYSRVVNFDMEKKNVSLISNYAISNKKEEPEDSTHLANVSPGNLKGDLSKAIAPQDSVRNSDINNDYMRANFNYLPIYGSSFRVKSRSTQQEQLPNLWNTSENHYGIKMTNPYQLEHGIKVSGAENFNAKNSISFANGSVTTSYNMSGKGILEGSAIELDTMKRPYYEVKTNIMDTNFAIASGLVNEANIGGDTDTEALSKEAEKVVTGSNNVKESIASEDSMDYALDPEYEIGEEFNTFAPSGSDFGNFGASAEDDNYDVQQGEILTITEKYKGLLGNDIPRDYLKITGNTQPKNGRAIVDRDDGLLSYIPNEDFCGEDSFTYNISRTDIEAVGSGTVTINVICKNSTANSLIQSNSPEKLFTKSSETVSKDNRIIKAANDTYSTRKNEPLVVDVVRGVLSNDQGDNLIVKTHSQPAQGNAKVYENGSLIYIPNKDFCGVDGFDYTVIDRNTQESKIAGIIIEIVCANGTVIPGGVFGSPLNSIYASENPIISGTSWGMAYIGYYYPAPISKNYTVGSTQNYDIRREKGRYVITEKNGKRPKQKYLRIGSDKAPINKVPPTFPGARFDILEAYPL
jgi:hypothetical protein